MSNLVYIILLAVYTAIAFVVFVIRRAQLTHKNQDYLNNASPWTAKSKRSQIFGEAVWHGITWGVQIPCYAACWFWDFAERCLDRLNMYLVQRMNEKESPHEPETF